MWRPKPKKSEPAKSQSSNTYLILSNKNDNENINAEISQTALEIGDNMKVTKHILEFEHLNFVHNDK